jgi:hypothetical protein
MKQVGTFPTPFGIKIPVFEAIDPSDPETVSFDLDGTMSMAGIYDPAARAACKRELHEASRHGAVDFDIVKRHGGGPILRVSLPVPREPVYPAIPDIPMEIDGASGPTVRGVLDNWITDVTDRHRWCDRAERLLWLVEHQLDALGTMPAAPAGLAISRLLTGVLENLGEHELECIEQASFYLLSDHEERRHAGRSWLLPVRSTWFADWIKARPAYRRVAKLCRAASHDVPSWAVEVTR